MVTIWTGAAKVDLQQIHQRLAAVDPAAAKTTIETIVAGADNLHETYQAGKPEPLLSGEKVPYKFITVGYYKILYTFNTEKVSIRSVFHMRQMAEQNQALLGQLDTKAAQVAADAEAAALATQVKAAESQPAPEVVETPTVETPKVETPTVETPTVETPTTQTNTGAPPETKETPDTSAEMDALLAKMKTSGTPASDGMDDEAMKALEAELLADDNKEKEEIPDVQDISLDDLNDTNKPEGGQQ
ncbi:type II toxin-antitoxin system RelE/ParE family toxin [uncultured Microscilla sp.]|uniref:type II toxin-antitoxin system RelE/ParE family toxin n=1 Tax=uncultured Microscilla sp. TaxID=432653 RepID=UPI00261AF47E|nr:type II toxin-antitoxin system RelE/ParE family toxin [uncultured Microscilla sp.]